MYLVCRLDLPSFPTRRSSDLARLAAAYRRRSQQAERQRRGDRARPSAGRLRDQADDHPDPRPARPRQEIRPADHVRRRRPDQRHHRDRKSTRLNSSHRCISYAALTYPLSLHDALPISLAWLQHTGADPNKLNVNGGAIALGHPLGASGTKLMTTLIHALHARGKKYGLQTMCEGGGLTNVTIEIGRAHV